MSSLRHTLERPGMAMDNAETGSVGDWLELSVEADSESVEAVSELMSRYAYGHGVAVYEHYRQDPDGDNLETDPSRPVTVVAYVPSGPQSSELIQRIENGLWHLRQIGPIGPLMQTERPEEDWANAWKEHFNVLRIGRRFVIRPTWREYHPEPDDIVIDLDPGMAFGTGHHPTTELCLRWLEDLPVAGKRAIDVGAGSGILTVALDRLGATSIDAVEVDEVAARALRENLSLNRVSDNVRTCVGDFGDGHCSNGQYDLVVANIISSILLKLSDRLVQAVAPGGVLLLSGVIDRHLDPIHKTYSELGMRIIEQRQIGDWFALLLTHES
jgi:ribosomal protein L11 methyltransferase